MNDFFDLSLEQLKGLCRTYNKSPVHAQHIYKAAYQGHLSQPWDVDPVPLSLREILQSQYSTCSMKIGRVHISKYDRSVKFVLVLHDERQIEAVLMPENSRMTLCLSSQVGCAQACVFCSTGRMGLIRQLSAGEIVGQVKLAQQWIRENTSWYADVYGEEKVELTNIVFMGMGEPLDNVQNVIKAITILTERMGFGFSKKRISVSTAGHLEGLQHLVEAHPTVSIAISLHAGSNQKRSQLMPINRRWNLDDLKNLIHDLSLKKTQGLLIQYTLINGVNDSAQDAECLVECLQGSRVKVNLIPFNDVEHSRFKAPSFESIQEFRDVLHQAGLRTMIRYSKGQDIAAACGQLIDK